MSFGQVVVDLEGAANIFFLGGPVIVFIRICQADIAERKIWIFVDRLLEIIYRLRHLARGALVPIETSLQVELVDLGIDRIVFRELLLVRAGKPEPELVGYIASNIILERY